MTHSSSSLPNGGPAAGVAPVNPASPAGPIEAVAANVRRLREAAGWSLGELARRSSVAKSTLSVIELGAGNPGLETLVAISAALGVPFGALITPRVAPVSVLRAGEGPAINADQASFAGNLLATTGRSAETECYTFRLHAPKEYRAEPHAGGVTEIVVCLKGRLRVGPLDAAVELRAGDRATFAGDQPHTYQARTQTAELFIVLSYA